MPVSGTTSSVRRRGCRFFKTVSNHFMKILASILFAVLLSCSSIQHRIKVDNVNVPRYHRHHSILRTISANGILINVYAPTKYEQDRVRDLAQSLNFTGQPMVSWWRITVLNRADWEENLIRYNLVGRTNSAFTVLGEGMTFLNEEYLFFAVDERVRFTLAHEAAHEICECQSEDRANEIARILINTKR